MYFGRTVLKSRFLVLHRPLFEHCGHLQVHPAKNSLLYPTITGPFINNDFCSHLRCFNNESTKIYIMSFLFCSKANPITVSNNTTTLTTNLGLQQPTPSKLATFVAAADEKEVKNDYVYHEMNDQKTKTFNRKKTSLPSTARQELYKLAPRSVDLDEDDIHVSFEELTAPDNAKKYSVTVAHNPIHKLKDILKQLTIARVPPIFIYPRKNGPKG